MSFSSDEANRKALEKIRRCEGTATKELDLEGLSLVSIPSEVFKLLFIAKLDLGPAYQEFQVGTGIFRDFGEEQRWESRLVYNYISHLPAEIGKLVNLTSLNLSKNMLSHLPAEIGKLTNLTSLNLSGNKIEKLPIEIQNLRSLKMLDLRNNALDIPPEILDQINKPQIILDYLAWGQVEKEKKINEAKMLVVGEGSVGKTSLIKDLTLETFDQAEAKTDGIVIRRWQINDQYATNSQPLPIAVHVWDFGGQELMHATHQFFFTTRSLYLLVLDNRLTADANNIDYWLKIIESFGNESPVLIVGNKSDQHQLDIDRVSWQKKYPNIVGFLETSAATGAGINELKIAITEQINNLPHIRDVLPEAWFNVKKQLEEQREKTNFISYNDYVNLCAVNGVADEISQSTLIGFLHELGVVLHFQNDPRLEPLGILNPEWVTNGVYKIINAKSLFENRGVLTLAMLNDILNLPEYPRDKRIFIVDMMKKFELCYDVEADKTFLVPDLLPKDEPAELNFNGIPAFEYAYPVLPSSIITRFIVRMNQKIDDGLVWRVGVVLKIGKNKALVKANIEDHKITVAIDGTEHTRRDTLSAIRYQLDDINGSIKGLNPEKYIPIPNAVSAKPLKYEYLLKLERAGKEMLDIEDADGLREVNIVQMLNGVVSEYTRKQYGNVTNINIHGNVSKSSIIVGNKNQVIQNSYKEIDHADITPELKETLLQLGDAVDAMIQMLPAERAADVVEDFGKLADEAIKSKPNQKWYSVSIEGLIKAAENLDKLGTPVISLSRKVLSLLTGNMIK